MKKKYFICLIICFITRGLAAQIPQNGLDVLHCRYEINLNDSTDIIRAVAIISARFTKNLPKVRIDLTNRTQDGKGMNVTDVSGNGTARNYTQDPQHLVIDDPVQKDDTSIYIVTYEGIPADGLIIKKNNYGHRTFFADNWPDRAHNWIPCNDHVSDKASVDFIVTAPGHYQVISNGIKTGEKILPGNLKQTSYHEISLLPAKIMVIGVADFNVEEAGLVNNIPVTSWVYPEDSDRGFHDYARAVEILQFFNRKIGPYPYQKLANVESTTMYGGMENANAIFYTEGSITGTSSSESLLAHEISHQWFGDAVTESDWPHIWLSEGFATYMTTLYLEEKYGADTMRSVLISDRRKIIRYSRRNNTPVVDTAKTGDLTGLLNTNTYQKGGWILHMLRRKVGDSLFWKSIQNYYTRFSGSNASTSDLQNIFEETTHLDLDIFFRQWLYTSGQPSLKISWKYNQGQHKLFLSVEQLQKDKFEFPLEIGIKTGDKMILKSLEIKDLNTSAEIYLDAKPLELIADPNVNLLFEAEIVEIE